MITSYMVAVAICTSHDFDCNLTNIQLKHVRRSICVHMAFEIAKL